MYPVFVNGKKVCEILPGTESWFRVEQESPGKKPHVEVHFGMTKFHCEPENTGIFHGSYTGDSETPEFLINWTGGTSLNETIRLTEKKTYVTYTQVVKTEVEKVYENNEKLEEIKGDL